MTTWPDVVEAAMKLYGTGTPLREIRMSESTRDELVRRLEPVTSAVMTTPAPDFGGAVGTIFGTPVTLDEGMTGTRWEMRGYDGAVIQSGAL